MQNSDAAILAAEMFYRDAPSSGGQWRTGAMRVASDHAALRARSQNLVTQKSRTDTNQIEPAFTPPPQ